MILNRTWKLLVGMVIALLLAVLSPWGSPRAMWATSPPPPGRAEVCQIVITMPGSDNTDDLLMLLDTRRSEVTSDLIAMKQNMEQYDAEGYGWQNVIDGSSALEPRPGSWLIGALRMACEE